jgi:RNA polymerase sigma-70 factor, ECF subfamily
VPSSDLQIVKEVRAGDREAFRLLVDRYSHRIFRLGYRMTGNEDDAEEVVQETFLRGYKSLHKYDGRASFGTWAFRIATNYALDLLRSRQRHPEASTDDQAEPAAEALQERLAASGEIRSRYQAALGLLSEKERSAFLLRHHEGMSIPEAGAMLGLSDSATKHSVFRAVQKLRQALAPFVGSTVNGVRL